MDYCREQIMKHLHITNTEKFIEPFIELVNSNFDINEHHFSCFNSNEADYIRKNHVNLFKFDKKVWDLRFIKALYAAEHIYIHGLFDMRIVMMFFLQPWLLRKCKWIVWGGDLYLYLQSHSTIKAKVKEFVRAIVIKRIGGLITHIKGDYELASKWYGVRGSYYYSFMYPSNSYKEIPLPKKVEDDFITYIQVGNSADPSNNHLDIFEKLSSLNPKNIKIICPLSYGDKEYAKKVADRGKEKFGNDFEPLFDFLPFDKYLNLISEIDIAIFNHKRQQAVGNIMTLLGLGKKVYIREDITTWDFGKAHGLKLYSINSEFQNALKPITDEIKCNNIKKVKNQFSEKKLISDWRKIFEGK
jgi:dTDP-N-acetylfucosamine:lipid II N-acetylfucosaminyltransferase